MKQDNKIIINYSNDLLPGITRLIEQAKQKVAISSNVETSCLYWSIGNYINTHLKENNRLTYGAKIVATLSQQLIKMYGKGYSYSALTRMCKVTTIFDETTIATVSQQLSWSHLIELSSLNSFIQREFYAIMSIQGNWGIRELRTQMNKMLFERSAIAQLPEEEIVKHLKALKQENTMFPDLVFKNTYVLDFLNLPHFYNENELENALLNTMEHFIMELGNGFAFLERQKRITVDEEDYYLDLLFYHRKLNRLIAIDLKLGKFKPAYKGQMELYLRWLEKYEMQKNEEKPIGLLLCSEGNTEHIELLLLNESEIKVAQYLTEFPDKQWFSDKLQKALKMAKMNENLKNINILK